ncbi:MAG: glycosyltransferase family A protein [Flavipsychrobacter sp.]
MITVINLCYNTGKLVVDTLKSINDQTYKDFQVIIIDDASSDDSVDVVEDWLKNNAEFKYQFLKNEKNIGISKSLNLGLKHASGQYIAIIGDDLWEPKFLEKGIQVFQVASPKLALVSTKAMSVDTRTNFFRPINNYSLSKLNYPRFDKLYKPICDNVYLMKSEYVNDYMYWMNPIVAFTILIDKNKLENIGGFCESYSFEDYPTWFKLSQHYDFAYIDTALGKYLVHGQNFSLKKKYLMDLDTIKMFITNYRYLKYPDSKQKLHDRISHLSLGILKEGSPPQKLRLLYHIMISLSRLNFTFSIRLLIWLLRNMTSRFLNG